MRRFARNRKNAAIVSRMRFTAKYAQSVVSRVKPKQTGNDAALSALFTPPAIRRIMILVVEQLLALTFGMAANVHIAKGG
jgi:hypothetical protein